MSHVIGTRIRTHSCQKNPPEPHSDIRIETRFGSIRGDKTVAEPAQQFDAHANQITQWKMQLLDRAGVVFEGNGHQEAPPIDVNELHAKIGELALENDFLEGALTKAGLLSAKR